MPNYVMGIDAGTESVRVGIFDEKGKCVAFGVSGYDTQHKHPGWAEQNVDDWEKALMKAMKIAVERSGLDPKDICALGVDGTSCTPVFLDKNGEPVRPAILWMDVRAHEEARFIDATKHRMLKYTGFAGVSPEWFPCKVMWVKKYEPEVYKATSCLFEHTDWLAYKLTGVQSLNLNTVTIRWFYDITQGGFQKDFLELLGLSDVLQKIPKVVLRPGEMVGGLKEDIAKEVGLKAGIPVAAGAADAYVAAIGVNALETGRFALITGSSHLHIGIVNEEVHIPGIFGAFPEALIPNCYAIEGGQISTGSIVRWFKSNMVPTWVENEAQRSGKSVYRVLDDMASKVPVGSNGVLVLDHWQGNRTPWVDSTSRGVIRGLTLGHSTADIFRAILEGVAYGTKLIFQTIEKSGISVNEVVMCGGVVNSPLWIQIHADVLGKPIILPSEPQAASLGSAILASVAARLYQDITSAARNMVAYTNTVEPIKENYEKYEQMFEEYINTYQALRESSKKLVERLKQF